MTRAPSNNAKRRYRDRVVRAAVYASDILKFDNDEAAEVWLKARGFSLGRMQAGSPRGVLLGDFDIAKWRNLRPDEVKALDGELIRHGRTGPAFLHMKVEAWTVALVRGAAEATP